MPDPSATLFEQAGPHVGYVLVPACFARVPKA